MKIFKKKSSFTLSNWHETFPIYYFVNLTRWVRKSARKFLTHNSNANFGLLAFLNMTHQQFFVDLKIGLNFLRADIFRNPIIHSSYKSNPFKIVLRLAELRTEK